MIYENDKNSMIHYKIGKWLMTSGKWNCFTCLVFSNFVNIILHKWEWKDYMVLNHFSVSISHTE